MDHPRDNTSPASCPIEWCRKVHIAPAPEQAHWRDLGTFGTLDTAMIGLSLVQFGDGPTLVRMFVDTAGPLNTPVHEKVDFSLHFAFVLGHALAGLPLGEASDFITTMTEVSVLVGEREPSVDPLDGPMIVSSDPPRPSALDVEAGASTHHDEEAGR
ncbi:hypothetical protein [Sphaerisporangium sp. TRM90804]|uniref:hypothetical protein n=1 Tax=Sphaerisporangium sp. TRM90804 TaxID=3031113 RepID=UPI00244C80E2|nr:hypothetical protein [Sphaerisporangium sp. TRM90804]MDH2429292.1 hypothetical protein [Sphaerisporangium sp. TRM90804]